MEKFLRKVLFLLGFLLVCTYSFGQIMVLTEDFESGGLTTNNWTQDPTTESSSWAVDTTGVIGLKAYEGSNYAYLTTQTYQAPVKLISSLENISSLISPILSFYVATPAISAGGRDTLVVYARNSATDTWAKLETIVLKADTWEKKVISLQQYVYGNVQVAFEHRYGNGRGVALDKISIGAEPVCTQPTDLSSINISHNSATLFWNANIQTQRFSLKISTTPISDFSVKANVLDTTNLDPFVLPMLISNLSPATTYYWYVQADCDHGDISPWSAQAKFTTYCVPVNVPYSENFDGYGISSTSFPSCWHKAVIPYGDWGTSTVSSGNIPQCSKAVFYMTKDNPVLKLSSAYSTTSGGRGSTGIAITPRMDVSDIRNYQVSFMLHGTVNSKLRVGLVSNPDDMSTYEEIAVVMPHKTHVWQKVSIPLSLAKSNKKHIILKVDGPDRNYEMVFYIEDFSVEPIASCGAVSPLNVIYTTPNSAKLTWEDYFSAYNVKVSTTRINPATTAADTHTATTSTSDYVVNNLQPNKTYYWYVQSDCGNGQLGPWTEDSLTTACAANTIYPYVQGFEEGPNDLSILPNCWISEHTGYAGSESAIKNLWKRNAGTVQEGKNSIYFPSMAAGNKVNLVTPPMHIPADSSHWVKFWMYRSHSSTLREQEGVKVWSNSTPDTIGATFLRFIPRQYTLEPSVLAVGWYEYKAIIPNSGDLYIIFEGISENTTAIYMDNITIEEKPTCITPDIITTTDISATSATVSWQKALNETSWHLKVFTSEIDSPQDLTAPIFDDTVFSPSQIISGLTMNTRYYVYLKSVCNTGNSSWEKTAFKTACSSIMALPYTESFDIYGTGTTVRPECWTVILDNNYPRISGSNNTYKGAGSLNFVTTAKTVNKQIAVLPEVNVAGKRVQDLQMDFFIYADTELDKIEVGVMTDPTDTNTFVLVKTIKVLEAKKFIEQSVSFASYTGSGKHIAFRSLSNFVTKINIDDVLLDVIPTCPRPVDVVRKSIGSDFIKLSWTPKGAESAWEVAYGFAGFDPDGVDATIITANQSTHFVTGLTSNTAYDFYVRAVCSGGDHSAWSRPVVQATTSVPGAAIPYSSTFDDAADNAAWMLINGEEHNTWWFGNAAHTPASDGALYISNDNGLTNTYVMKDKGDESQVYAARLLALPEGEINITFDWRANGRSTYDYLCAFLIPAEIALPAAGSYAFSSYIFSPSSLKSGWILLGNNKLNLSEDWNNFSATHTISDAGNYNLVFFWNNYYASSAPPGLPPAAIDNLHVTQITCATPIDLTASATLTTADLAWRSFNGATQWHLKVSSIPLEDPQNQQADVLNDTVTSNPYTLPGLTPNTVYYYYVQSLCGVADNSNWANGTFRTECGTQDVFPYVENFEMGAIKTALPCWTNVLKTGDAATEVTSTSADIYKGIGAMIISSNKNQNYVATPELNITSMNKMMVTFKARASGSSSSTTYNLRVGAMSDLNDFSTYQEMANLTLPITWGEYTVLFDSYVGDGKYIVFGSDAGKSNTVAIDNVVIQENRACKQPFDVLLGGVTETTAQLIWASANPFALYNLMVSTTPINPDSVVGEIVMSSLPSNYATVHDLVAGTTYYAYIQSDCGTSEGSYWSTEFVFTTPCTPRALPYVENFDQNGYGTDVSPSCWQHAVLSSGVLPAGSTYTYHPYCNKGTFFGSDSIALRMYAYYSAGKATSKTMAILPAMSADINALQMRFSHNGSFYTNTKLYVGTLEDLADYSTYDSITEIPLTSSWENATISFEDYAGNGKYIVLMTDGELVGKSYVAFIDQLIIDSLRSCQAPSTFDVSEIEALSAKLSWESLSKKDTMFHVQVATVNVGSNIHLVDTISTFAVDTVVTNVYDLVVNGLEGQTDYYAYIRVKCNDSTYSERYSRPIYFRTKCDAQLFPYIESFDEPGTTLPECWLAGGTYGSKVSRSTFQKYDDSRASLYFYNSHTTYNYVVLPLMADSIKNTQLTFMLYAQSRPQNVIIGAVSDPDNFATFDSITTIHPSVTYDWEEKIVPLNDYTGTGKYIVILSGTRNDGATSSLFYIDNLQIDRYTTCLRPTEIQLTAATTTSATLTWTPAGDETSWDLLYGSNGFDPSKSGTLVPVASNPAMITGLIPAKFYDVYIRANCEGGEISNWRGPISFYTQQQSDTLPFFTDFENPADNALWIFTNNKQAGNKWYIGDGVKKNTSPTALYISKDGGVSHEYDGSSLSYAYAYRTVDIEPGAYSISFDWMGYGQTGTNVNYDLLRAFLIPASENLATDSPFGMTSSINTTPKGWIDMTKKSHLNQELNWVSLNDTVNLNVQGSYKLAFFWKNDANTGNNPPAAVDNVRFEPLSCYLPFGLNVESMSDSSAVINWVSDAEKWQLKVDVVDHRLNVLDTITATAFDGIVTSLPYELNNLQAGTMYYYYLRGICGNDTSEWVRSSFRTACSIVYVTGTDIYYEGFDTYGTGEGTSPFCWTTGTNHATVPYPYCTTTSVSTPASLYFYSYSNIYSYGATPEIHGDSIKNMEVRFKMRPGTSNTCMLVGVMTNPLDVTTFEVVDSVCMAETGYWEDCTVRFSDYTGQGKYVAFMLYTPTLTSNRTARIDDVTIEVIKACAPTIGLTASVTTNSADLSWSKQATDSQWRVKVAVSSIDPASPDATLVDTVVTTNTVTIDNLNASSSYVFYVQNICGGQGNTWSAGYPFTTACGVATMPYMANFEYAPFPPACWQRMEGLATDAFNGTKPTVKNSGWSYVRNNNGIKGNHVKINASASTVKHWLVTPEMAIESGAVLSFNLALTIKDGATGITNMAGQNDDKFMVIVSTDGGNTWAATDATVWDNQSGDFVYNQIPHTGQRFNLDLSKYSGDTVVIAFYAESTNKPTAEDNDLHLGNIRVNTTAEYTITDNSCLGYSYTDNGFNIDASLLQTPGSYTFSRIAENLVGADSIISITLLIQPNAETHFYDTIMAGVPYTGYGFYNITQPGRHERAVIGSDGCDSIIVLNLVMDVVDNIDPVLANAITIYPNPVKRGSAVEIKADLSTEELTGLKVEVFNSMGMRIYSTTPTSLPMQINCFDQSGVYVVRITTGNNRRFISKVIVK